jgi:tetrahydromethanopterin S-methyltransferase subunit G
MTIDERIERLLAAQEALSASQQRLSAAQDKTQVILVDVLDSIKRLERIVLAHSLDIDDIQKRLDELEQRRRKKPQ